MLDPEPLARITSSVESGAEVVAEGRPEREHDLRGIAPATPLEPGRHYRLVTNPLDPIAGEAGRNVADLADAIGIGSAEAATGSVTGAVPVRVEVVQFFMYGCHPCYAFEPHVEGWRTEAEHVELFRVPVVFNPQSQVHARAFYTAEALGVLDALHGAFFSEVHERGNRLDTETALSELFARVGIDGATFLAVFRSREIAAKVDAAKELAHTLGVSATPSLVVDRRYMTSPAMTGSYEETFTVLGALVESAREAGADRDRCPPDSVTPRSSAASGSGAAPRSSMPDSGAAAPEVRTLADLLELIERGRARDCTRAPDPRAAF